MATQIEVPPLGESVTQAILIAWKKKDGEPVNVDEPVAELETDKANVDIPAKASGVLRQLKEEGETVSVGEVIARIDDGAGGGAAKNAAASAAPVAAGSQPAGAVPEDYSPAVRRLLDEHRIDPKQVPATGPNGRLTKEDVEAFIARQKDNGQRGGGVGPGVQAPASPTPPATPPRQAQSAAAVTTPSPIPQTDKGAMSFDEKGEHRVPMSKIRKRIAETLVKAQQTAAILTTFNEVDLTEVSNLRTKFKEPFEKAHGVGLGYMSFFCRAVVLALREIPRLNAFIEDDNIVYHKDINLGIAVSTDRGLAVPVLRRVQEMSFARIEAEIKRLATATREGKLSLEELSGGTFSITNGGVFGSLLSTPILNPPQSGILGMHNIQKRPVVINDGIEVRQMMYLALSYDHRLVDGKEAITFLVRVKQLLEDPARLMLEI
jgi:2-oxoglutarate dehydrogenase E2 component (dihydrolipoamide succinyltransferase)